MVEHRAAPVDQTSGTRRLTVLYVAALSAIALLTIAGQAGVQWSLAQQRRSSTVINVAGRQRMMSQKLTKTALLLADAEPADWERLAAELQTTANAWKRAHRGLQQGDVDLELPGRNSLEVERLFRQLTPHYQAMLAGMELVAAGEAEAGVSMLLEHEPVFLDTMDAIVDQYDREAQAELAWLTWEEGFLLAVTLCVLLIEGLFIFRPAVARIRSTMVALAHAKQAAEAANAEKTRFLARMSHELRTPLNVILGLIDVQLAKPAPLHREHLLTMRDAAEGLLRLVDDLLEIGQFEAGGELQLRLAPVEVADLVARTVQMFEQTASHKGLILTYHGDATLPAALVTDAGRVQQLVINLVNNGLKFTDSGSVRVSLKWSTESAERGTVTLTVADSGIGIDPQDHQRIFDSFTQLAHVQRPRQQGVGLGLHIVARLVNALQGTISVASQPGAGSTFTLRLPMQVGTAVAARQRDVATTSPRHLLLIEDAQENQFVCEELLGVLGHSCDIASTAAEGLQCATRDTYDAVLLDIELPDASGLDVVKQLRLLPGYESVLIAAVSAHALDSYREAALAAGFTSFVSKPIRLEDLRGLVGDARGAGQPGTNSAQGLQRWADRPALLQSLIQLFQDEWPRQLQQLAQAVAEQDARQTHFHAHRIKGLILNFDDEPSRVITEQLESTALRDDLSPAPQLYEKLAAALQSLAARLEVVAADADRKLS